MHFEVLTQANRPNHMSIVEVWENPQRQIIHSLTADAKNFRDGLHGIAPGSGVPADPQFLFNPLTGSLYDERFYQNLD